MKYTLGSVVFDSKKAAKERIQSILHSYPLGQPLAADDLALVCAMLESHPEREAKVGVGIESVEVRINVFMKKTRGFWINRTDGSQVAFSYIACFQKESKEAKVKAALRRAIRPQCDAYLDDCFSDGYGLICCVSLEPVERRNAEVDHAEPNTFQSLVERWTKDRGINLAALDLTKEEIGESIADDQVSADWQAFHYEHARLRVICKDAHKAITHGWSK